MNDTSNAGVAMAASANDETRPVGGSARELPEHVLRDMLKRRGVKVVSRELVRAGYYAPRAQLESIRAALIASGEVSRIVAHGCCAPRYAADPIEPEEASELLLSRIRQLFYRTAAERGCSVEAAQIKLNYSCEQIQRMSRGTVGTRALPFVPSKPDSAFTLGGVGSGLL